MRPEALTEVQRKTGTQGQNVLKMCAGFGWSRVNFLHSSKDKAMFWICPGNSADNRDVIVIAELCSQRVKAFSAAHITLEEAGDAQKVRRGHRHS